MSFSMATPLYPVLNCRNVLQYSVPVHLLMSPPQSVEEQLVDRVPVVQLSGPQLSALSRICDSSNVTVLN
jgi:hypothetical protein